MNGRIVGVWRVLPVFLTLAACGTSPATHFYMLKASDRTGITRTLPGPETVSIVIAPVAFPGYLDRPQIVTRTEGAEVHLSEVHRWAEPLRENFTRVLAANLSRQLGTENIGIEASRLRVAPDYRLAVEVRRFDATREGEVTLVAYWSLRDRDGDGLGDMRKSEISLAAGRGGDYAEMIEALSAALARLSLEISEAIRDLPPT